MTKSEWDKLSEDQQQTVMVAINAAMNAYCEAADLVGEVEKALDIEFDDSQVLQAAMDGVNFETTEKLGEWLEEIEVFEEDESEED